MADEKEINELLDRLLEDRNTEEVVGEGGLLTDLTKRLMERVLEAEITDHLGYDKHALEGRNGGNSRNGHTRKRVKTGAREVENAVPHDREGTFEPQFIARHQRRLAGFDEKVIALYASCMTSREIQGHLKDLYQVEVSPTLISSITDAVLDEVGAWQSLPLELMYPIVFLDAIHLKVRSGGHIQTHAVYVALALNLEGEKELLGLCGVAPFRWTGSRLAV